METLNGKSQEGSIPILYLTTIGENFVVQEFQGHLSMSNKIILLLINKETTTETFGMQNQ